MEPQLEALVLGTAGTGRHSLLHALQASATTANNCYVLHLDTKYYTASVHFGVGDLQHDLGISRSTKQALAGLQALILVFDVSSRSSYDELRCWHEQHEAVLDCEIKLVVANKMDRQQGQQQASNWLAEVRSWCYSNGFEYIEAAAGVPSVDAVLQEDGEPQGVARVLATMQAHMWPNMVPKKQPQQQQGVSRAVPSSAAGAAPSGTTSSATRDQGLAASSSAGPSSNSTASTSQQEQGSQVPALQDKDAPASSSSHHQPQHQSQADAAGSCSAAPVQQSSVTEKRKASPARGSAAAGGGAAAGEPQGDDDLDPFLGADLDDFESLMRQVMGVRARLSGLPDAERRAAAADLALKLSGLMGLEDDSEGGSEEEGQDGRRSRAGADASMPVDTSRARA